MENVETLYCPKCGKPSLSVSVVNQTTERAVRQEVVELLYMYECPHCAYKYATLTPLG